MDQGVTRAVTREEFEAVKSQVEENLKITQDTNKLLHRMRHVGRIAFAAKIIIWILVLGLPLLLYPYIAAAIPSLRTVAGSTTPSSLTSSSLFGYPSPAEIQELFHPAK
jgi:hypothetical protein